MLFNSYIFILLFLPVTMLGYYALAGRGMHRPAITWLIGASLVFYGWWSPPYLILLCGSVLVNYWLGERINQYDDDRLRKRWMIGGIAFNLALLGYFKYANFFVDNVNLALGADFELAYIFLPLGISFFTIQQIAYLADKAARRTSACDFLHYSLFVTFFPQLIAGPIVQHHETIPQFMQSTLGKFKRSDIAIGLTIFFIGLFKKVVIADSYAEYASPAFAMADSGGALTFFEGWLATICYTFQLYFDFSGYSDMAIGISRMFGVKLPVNFHSPYKATGIIEFWRRWHMSLTRFITAYVFTPLATSLTRKAVRWKIGKAGMFALSLAVPSFITFLLVGLWHGAGWTFVLFGLIHGALSVINYGWRGLRKRWARGKKPVISIAERAAYITLTMLVIMFTLAIFRATTLDGAWQMWHAMLGLNGLSLPEGYIAAGSNLRLMLEEAGLTFQALNVVHSTDIRLIIMSLPFISVIVWFMPNTQQLLWKYEPALLQPLKAIKNDTTPLPIRWQPTAPWLIYIWLVAMLGLLCLTRQSEFLYFQF